MRSAVSNRARAGCGRRRERAARRARAGDGLTTVLLCAVVMLCLTGIGYKVWRQIAEQRSLSQLRARLSGPAAQVVVILPADTPAPADAAQEAPASTPTPAPTSTPDSADADVSARLSNLRTLAKENAELFGWLSVEDTRIDYPVMFSPDRPWYYLDHDFAGEASKRGLPFIDESCNPFDSRANLLLHGHNMKDGSMFAGLHALADADYYKAHRTLTFYTQSAAETYRILAVARAEIVEDSAFKYYLYTNIGTEDEFYAYVRLLRAHTLHAWDTDAVWGDALLTLSTCSKHATHGRLVVVAKRVE